MKAVRPASRFVHVLISAVLVVGLFPVFAQAEEPSGGRSVADGFVESSREAQERFATSGKVDDLVGSDAYEGDNGEVASLLSVSDPSYDLRAKGVVTSVKNQSPWGTCWAFGAIAAAETSIMSELGWTVDGGEVDLSELHLAWFSYTPLPADAGSQAGEGIHPKVADSAGVLDQGGSPFTATSVFSSGIGPVSESDAPYKNKENLTYPPGSSDPLFYMPEGDWSVAEEMRFDQALELENSWVLPSPAGRDAQGNYQYNEAGTQAIKSELAAGRAVEIAFCADTSQPGQQDPAKYIDLTTWAHYTYDSNAGVNHAVTIVGWDDTYGKSNFIEGHEPPGDGAWIVKNSWGTNADVGFPNQTPNGWGVDGKGFFYLSYYDMSINEPESFEFYAQEYGKKADYYLIDQYDYMPSTGVQSVQSEQQAAMANVFEASEYQRVRSLSCETAAPGTIVTYRLYLLNEGYANPEDGTLLTTLTETYAYGGYHRIQLGEGFPMNPGQHYSVVVTESTPSGYEVLTDRSLNEAGMRFVNDTEPQAEYDHYAVGVVNAGESFLFDDGDWSDWTESIAEIKESDIVPGYGPIFDYDNFPIKAYADPMEGPQMVEVPDLSNLTEAEALAALQQLGLSGQAGAAEYSDTVEAGRVVRQGTPAGTSVEVGAAVTYCLSLGKEPTPVPVPVPTPAEPASGASKAGTLANTGDGIAPFIGLFGLGAVACLGVALFGIRRVRQNKVADPRT